MKHKTYKYAKYGIIVAAGMLLMALPMTVMAQKNTEAADTVELETTTEASNNALESADKEEAASETTAAEKSNEENKLKTSENDVDTEETTAASKGEDTTTSTVTEDKSNTSETAKDAEEETAAPEKSTEDVVEDANAAEENGAESKSETETATEAETEAEAETAAETETETTVAETTAELKPEDELASGIIGTWAADENTGLSFGEDNKGKLIIPDEYYAFSYKIDKDQLSLDFVSSKATDGTYTASVSGDTLTLIGGKGTIGGTFELSRSK